jgi:hypothetical protein
MDGKPLWQDYVPEVRKVLIGIRDASDAMAEVGRATAYDRIVNVDAEDAKAIYAAMLDCALWDDA